MIDDLFDIIAEIGEEHLHTNKTPRDENDDWPMWYASKLLEIKEFSELAGQPMTEQNLISILLKIDKNYLSDHPDQSWEEYFAKNITDFF